jgi:hypothetical protein
MQRNHDLRDRRLKHRCIEYHQYEKQSKNDESQRNNADTHQEFTQASRAE